MRDQLSSIFSYLFMSSAVICLISAFGVIIIFIRSFVQDIGIAEKQTGFLFLYIFIIAAVSAPIFLLISNRLEKYSGRMDEI
jgi:hypothetical protein